MDKGKVALHLDMVKEKTRQYLCNQHEGPKALLELFQTLRKADALSQEQLREAMDEAFATRPGLRDRQDLEASLAVSLMRFQHEIGRKIVEVEATPTHHDQDGLPAWNVNVHLDEEAP
jgi:hypothetical protein